MEPRRMVGLVVAQGLYMKAWWNER